MNDLLREIQRCLRRLERSDTQLKRHNARVAYRRASRALDREVDLAYRPIRDDGTEVPRAKRKGRACPYCSVPFKSMGQLVTHLQKAHEWGRWSRSVTGLRLLECVCGKQCKNNRQLVRHLSGIKCLVSHVGASILVAQHEGER